MNPPEPSWIEGLRQGDQAAFEAIFHHYYERLGRYGMRYLADPEEVRDLVQALFVRLWEKRATLPHPLNLSAYLHTAVRNACLKRIDHYRVRQAHQSQVEEAPAVPSPQDHLEAHETAEHIRQALAALPARCREAFLLTRQEGLSYREAATRMGVSPKTVEVQVSKALKRLREHLGEALVLLMLMGR